MENMDKGLTVPQWVQINICPICLPKPKSSGFQFKRLHWASMVLCMSCEIKLDLNYFLHLNIYQVFPTFVQMESLINWQSLDFL